MVKVVIKPQIEALIKVGPTCHDCGYRNVDTGWCDIFSQGAVKERALDCLAGEVEARDGASTILDEVKGLREEVDSHLETIKGYRKGLETVVSKCTCVADGNVPFITGSPNGGWLCQTCMMESGTVATSVTIRMHEYDGLKRNDERMRAFELAVLGKLGIQGGADRTDEVLSAIRVGTASSAQLARCKKLSRHLWKALTCLMEST